MADAKALLDGLLTALNNLHGLTLVPMAQRLNRNSPWYKAVYNLGVIINNYKRQSLTIQASTLQTLVKIADVLDENGRPDLADRLDEVIQQSKQNVELTNDLIELTDQIDGAGLHSVADTLDNVIAEEEIQPPHEGNLSTRYCPDHRGVQTFRVDDHIYQCPMDGKRYDYENGYINYRGQRVPGGSVAAQTPDSADYGGIPMRIYDSRQNILRSVF